MFVFSSGKPNTVNVLRRKREHDQGWQGISLRNAAGTRTTTKCRTADGPTRNCCHVDNVWTAITAQVGNKTLNSPGTYFRLALAEGPSSAPATNRRSDLVVDPMVGSGTTLRAAMDLERKQSAWRFTKGTCGIVRAANAGWSAGIGDWRLCECRDAPDAREAGRFTSIQLAVDGCRRSGGDVWWQKRKADDKIPSGAARDALSETRGRTRRAGGLSAV